MEIKVVAFGQLAELLGESFIVSHVQDTDAFMEQLQQQFPALQHIPFKIAINKKIINSNTPIKSGVTIALLPPFSGG